MFAPRLKTWALEGFPAEEPDVPSRAQAASAGVKRAPGHHSALRIAAAQAIRRFLASSTPSPTHFILDEFSHVLVDE
jgi:hypothetical protein